MLKHKSEKGEAFADKNPDFTDKSGRKCFAPTAKNRLLQETTMSLRLTTKDENRDRNDLTLFQPLFSRQV
jgi:hypothetical protein